MKLTPAMEDYLKTIYRLQQGGETVSTNMLAEQLNFRPASVTGMIKKLAELQLLEHTPYYGVRLTAAGTRAALETLRHHRLLELYLTEKLGYSWDEVHEEADRLEHHISERLEARLFEALGEPTHDPHGDPIPTLGGDVPALEMSALTSLAVGERGIIAQVRSQDDEVLRYLREQGFGLHVSAEVISNSPVGGTVSVRVEGERDVTMSREIGDMLMVLVVPHPEQKSTS
jgi:DtxR family Mn-dependent transcriptional regulator